MAIDVAQVASALQNRLTERRFAKGEMIVREGDPGNTLYVVADGVVELLVGDQLLDILEVGNFFGEMSIVDQEPRSATAVATRDCVLIEVDGAAFRQLIIGAPEIVIEIMRVMAQRIRRLNQIVSPDSHR